MNVLRVIARPMLASIFIAEGVDALRNTDEHVEQFDKIRPALEKVGVPPVLASDARFLAKGTGIATIIAGLGLATGRFPRFNAAVLAVLSLPLTMVKFPIWTKAGRSKKSLEGMLKNAAVAGGLILAIFDREGNPSWSWQLRNYLDQKEQVAAARAAVKERYAS